MLFRSNFRRLPSFPTAQPRLRCLHLFKPPPAPPSWLCFLPSSAIAITPTIFWASFLHTRRLMLFFTAATTILSSFFLVHQPTTVTGMLSSLFHHLHPNFIVAFPSLPHFHGYLVYPPSPHRHGSVVFSSPPRSRPKNSRNLLALR